MGSILIMIKTQQLITAASAVLLTTSLLAEEPASTTAVAEETNASSFFDGLVLWQDNSLTFLTGKNYEVDPSTQHTLTFEHASGWSFGDLFIFVDGTHFDGDENGFGNKQSYYGEFAPRFSAGKILNKDLSYGIIKDVNLATCWEFGKDIDDDYLVGPGFDLDLPGFDFFQLNVYRRFDDGKSDMETYQLTTAWKYTHPVGKSTFVCDGFMDWVFGDGTDHLHFCPQLKFDVGVFAGIKPMKLFTGIEYDYWKNKYGIKDTSNFDTDQNTFSWIVKYHF